MNDKLMKKEQKETSPLIHKQAINFLVRFYILLKILKLYAENNELIEEQTRLLFEEFQKLKELTEEITFRIRQESIFFNQTRLKFSLANYPIFKALLEEFRKKEIGHLSISPEIQPQTLKEAIAVLGQRRTGTTPFEEIVAELNQR
ncbi:MAG: hypothetical protein H5U07_04985, partial [Candidatus Aminicenantes bacterium]|nr:hypothetical protein [Candidatus Aminicenantes bacterium]